MSTTTIEVLRFIVNSATPDDIVLILEAASTQQKMFAMRKRLEEKSILIEEAIGAWRALVPMDAKTEEDITNAFNKLEKRHRQAIAQSSDDINQLFSVTTRTLLNEKKNAKYVIPRGSSHYCWICSISYIAHLYILSCGKAKY